VRLQKWNDDRSDSEYSDFDEPRKSLQFDEKEDSGQWVFDTVRSRMSDMGALAQEAKSETTPQEDIKKEAEKPSPLKLSSKPSFGAVRAFASPLISIFQCPYLHFF